MPQDVLNTDLKRSNIFLLLQKAKSNAAAASQLAIAETVAIKLKEFFLKVLSITHKVVKNLIISIFGISKLHF